MISVKRNTILKMYIQAVDTSLSPNWSCTDCHTLNVPFFECFAYFSDTQYFQLTISTHVKHDLHT